MTNKDITVSLKMKHVFIILFVIGFVVSSVGMAALFNMDNLTGLVTAAAQDDSNGEAPDNTGSREVSVSSIEVENEPMIGQQDAPVTMVYWGDFQCPFCKQFEQQAFSQLLQNEIKEGTVRVVFKDFAFLGQDSTTGSIASECVWNQVGQSNPQAYWDWHSMMFQNQDGENSGWGNQTDIVAATGNVDGADADKLRSCMNNQGSQMQQEIQKDRTQGGSVGISGTPGFVIYKTGSDTGKQIVGAQPYSQFQSIISQVQSGSGQETSDDKNVDKTVTVSGTEYSFSPSTITIQKGQTVKVEFSNTGQVPHNLKIPSLSVGTRTVQPQQTTSFTFTAPSSGTFPIQFECTLPGHAANGMTGSVTEEG